MRDLFAWMQSSFYVNSASFVVFEQIAPGFVMLLIQIRLPVAGSWFVCVK